jgi:hypothetical protein
MGSASRPPIIAGLKNSHEIKSLHRPFAIRLARAVDAFGSGGVSLRRALQHPSLETARPRGNAMNRPPPADDLLSEMGGLLKRAAAWLYQRVPMAADSVDLHARGIVYSMLAQHLAQILPRSQDVDERDLLPALAGLLGEPDTTRGPEHPAAIGAHGRRMRGIQALLRKTILQIHVSYKRVRAETDSPSAPSTGKRQFVLECSLSTAIADKVAKTVLSRAVAWEEMPNVVTGHFIRSAEEIEMRLYPREKGE